MSLGCYLTTTTDGQQINAQGQMGGRLSLWDGQEFIDYVLWPNPNLFPVFGEVLVDGSPGELQDRTPYYVYLFLDGGELKANYAPVSGPRYAFGKDDGICRYTDPQGNVCTLIGMIFPRDGSVGCVLYGSGSCIRTSSSPFLCVPQQKLSAVSTLRGNSVASAAPIKLGNGIGIDACSWAWGSAESAYTGQIASAGQNVLFLKPFAKSWKLGHTHYGPMRIAHLPGGGLNVPVSGDGVCLATDDDAYHFGIEAWTGGGASVHVSLDHRVKGYV